MLGLVALLVAGGAAFGIGKATAGESEPAGGSNVEQVDVPSGDVDTPTLRDVGALPALRPAPSGGTAPPSEATPSEPVPSEPAPSEPAPPAPAPPEPAPPPPPPPEPAPPEPVPPPSPG